MATSAPGPAKDISIAQIRGSPAIVQQWLPRQTLSQTFWTRSNPLVLRRWTFKPWKTDFTKSPEWSRDLPRFCSDTANHHREKGLVDSKQSSRLSCSNKSLSLPPMQFGGGCEKAWTGSTPAPCWRWMRMICVALAYQEQKPSVLAV